MARKSRNKKEKKQGLQPMDPDVLAKTMKRLLKKKGKSGLPQFPETVRPGRCGGCDIRM